MILIKKLFKLVREPKRIVYALMCRGFVNWLSEKYLVKLQYECLTGKTLDLQSPITFNEKLQWLKIYGNNENYSSLVDKYEVRKYISEKIGEKYLIPLIDMGGKFIVNKFEEIDFNKLPEQFVLKCTHDSGTVEICKNKEYFDLNAAKKRMNKRMKLNYFYINRESEYKNINPKIICEKYMVDESETELKDYKIFCFNGVPRIIQVDYNRFINHKRNIYDSNWNFINASIKFPNDPDRKINRPNKLDEMLDIAKTLSKGHSHVRVDLYLVYDKIYFGELTFTHGGGFEKFDPEEFGYQMGNWIELSSQ